MSLKDFMHEREMKKREKKIAKTEKKAEFLTQDIDQKIDIANREEKAKGKMQRGQAADRRIERLKLEAEIREARQHLFVQRSNLLRKLINYNKEYKFTLGKPDTTVKKRELERCSQGAKNAAYALSVVDEAIERLDSIREEREWHEIMRDLTKGYKLMNAISVGSDVMTRLAFLLQRAKHDIKSDISLEAMEHYYGKPINELLAEQTGCANAAEVLVKDSVLDLNDEDAVLESIRWGTAFVVLPDEASEIAAQQSVRAQKSGGTPVYKNPEETFAQVKDFSAMDIDDMPSMM